MNFHWDILTPHQKSLLSKLSFLRKSCYLAGGTALALYFGHRTSLDFDFYTEKEFSRTEFSDILKSHFSEKDITITAVEENTFLSVIYGVNLSIFYYQYPLLKSLIEADKIKLASLEDIAVMKIIAIIQRPAKRDYIDMYFILKNFSLEKLFKDASKKYPNFNKYLALRALSYFEDVEKESLEKRGIKILDPNFSWRKVKEEIFDRVREYQLGMFKK